MNSLATALLRGRRLLFVQEQPGVDQDLRRELASAGAEVVGPARDLQQVVLLMNRSRRIDGAIIDLEFDEAHSIGIATSLLGRGIPFVFATGGSGLPLSHRFPGFVLCRKPIFLDEIATALFGDAPTAGSA